MHAIGEPLFRYDDGSVEAVVRRERPQLVFASDGHTPLYLSNGVQPAKGADYVYTLVLATNQDRSTIQQGRTL